MHAARRSLAQKSGFPPLREPRRIRGSFVEHSRCYRLIDGEVDAPDERDGAEYFTINVGTAQLKIP